MPSTKRSRYSEKCRRAQHRQHACATIRAVGRWASSSVSITTAGSKLQPGWVVPPTTGPDAVTRKLACRQLGRKLPTCRSRLRTPVYGKIIANPGDPNHLHYYAGSGTANLPAVRTKSSGMPLPERMATTSRFSGPVLRATNSTSFSYNRTKKKFIVLLYGGAGGTSSPRSLPSTIQDGKYYNNEFSSKDFRGEGFKDGKTIRPIVTKDISRDNGGLESPRRAHQTSYRNEWAANGKRRQSPQVHTDRVFPGKVDSILGARQSNPLTVRWTVGSLGSFFAHDLIKRLT